MMAGVAGELNEVQVEGTFPDGTKLVTIADPICREDGDLTLALKVQSARRLFVAANSSRRRKYTSFPLQYNFL